MYRMVDDDRFAHPVYLPPELANVNNLYEGRKSSEALAEYTRLAASQPAARAVLAALNMTGNLDLPIDRAKAEQLCGSDAVDGYPYAQYLMAWLWVERGELVGAVNWMRRAASTGFPPALLDMGRFYLNGIGVSKDRDIAIGWLRRARKAGHVLAVRFLLQQYKLGRRGVLVKWIAVFVWPLSSLYLRAFWRLHGPNSARYFFYNWPYVGKAVPDKSA